MGMTREALKSRLAEKTAHGHIIIAVNISSGLTARAAEESGADFLITYAGGKFRREGVPASLCELCYDDCNSATEELGRHILPRLEGMPLIGGIGCLDPYRDIMKFIDHLLAMGFSGITNLPSIGDWEGDFRTMPEQLGMGYEKEVELIRRCCEKGVFTIANCYTKEQAANMTDAGADVICIDLGATIGGLLKSGYPADCQEEIQRIKEISQGTVAKENVPILLFHGGLAVTPAMVERYLQMTGIHGFLGGSAIERIPVEKAVMDTIGHLKEILIRKGVSL